MSLLILLALLLAVYMHGWFAVALLKRRNDVADIAWGLGFVVLAWGAFFLDDTRDARALVVCLLVSVWGIRLAAHIGSRHLRSPEDSRYAKWRQTWGKTFYWRSYLQIFVLQGILLYLVALPVMLAILSAGGEWGILDSVGLLFFLTGFTIEAVADAQLRAFTKVSQNKGLLLQSGLWRYSRHPNYFGEITLWWGIFLISLAYPGNWWGVIGPLAITFLIIKVSGVPMLEAKMAQNPQFGEYARKTNKLIPWFQKSEGKEI